MHALQQDVTPSDQEIHGHLCREDASIWVSHVSVQVVQDSPRHACVRSIARQAEGIQVCPGQLPIVVQHLQVRQAQRRDKQSGTRYFRLNLRTSSRLHQTDYLEHLEF